MAKKVTDETPSTDTEPSCAGSRTSLPGQEVNREQWLRVQLSEELEPEGLIEKRWIEDIAYRCARLDHVRAQISGLQNRLVRDVLRNLKEAESYVDNESLFERPLNEVERDVLNTCEQLGERFETDNILDNPGFAWLLGRLTPFDVQLLKSLQGLEHDEARERDRVINQFERRRRLKAQHLIMLIEAKMRGALPIVCDSPELEAFAVRDSEIDGERSFP